MFKPHDLFDNSLQVLLFKDIAFLTESQTYDAKTVKLRAVEQLAEDQGNLLFDDSWAVVLDADLVSVFANGTVSSRPRHGKPVVQAIGLPHRNGVCVVMTDGSCFFEQRHAA